MWQLHLPYHLHFEICLQFFSINIKGRLKPMREKEWVWLWLTQRKTLFFFFFFNALFGIFPYKKNTNYSTKASHTKLNEFSENLRTASDSTPPLVSEEEEKCQLFERKKCKYTAFTYLNLVKYIPQISAMSFFGLELTSPPPPPWRFSENSSDLVREAFPYCKQMDKDPPQTQL